jgi:succinyl-diaminopimelate desuccinylase
VSAADASDLGERLARRTLALIDVPSVSGEEDALFAALRGQMPVGGYELVDAGDATLFYAPEVRRPGAPFVVLAGHVDTVPIAGNVPGRREGDLILGRGAADMKGALAVMVEAASQMVDGSVRSDLDVGLLFFGREELPITQSALLPLFERCTLARTPDLAVVMEPTANAIQVGCLGNLNARVMVHGVAAHSARPWMGDNAIHAAIRALASVADLPIRDVEIEGLTYREVVSVTTFQGGVAANVVPDWVEAHVNFRYAPTHTPAEAEARLRELLGHHPVDLEVVGNAPPGPVTVHNPLVARLQRATDRPIEPKQAWTPVAEFATVGVDAVNLGPGDPQYAHRDDERVEVASLVRSEAVLRAFLSDAATEA